MNQVIEVTRFVDGQYERRQITGAQILAERSERNQRPKPTIPPETPKLGFISRTVVPSPTINHIIPVRIRHQNKNDLVYVGEDFLRLYEIQDDGRLDFVTSREGLPRIVAAKAFGEPWQQLSDVEIKLENGMSPDIDTVWEKESSAFSESSSNASQAFFPPQLLVLTLETQELLFVYTKSDETNVVSFHAQTIALMSGSSILERPGAHLAVDPRSRAVAVAAPEKNVILFSTKSPQDMQGASRGWTFIQREAVDQIPGTVLKMDFLFPAEQDNDHVVLLIVHTHYDHICITCFDWVISAGLNARRKRLNALPLTDCQSYPLLLIPLQFSSDCIIATEDGIYYLQKILANAGKVKKVRNAWEDDVGDRTSKRAPLWASWTRVERAHRFHDRVQEDFYIIREDGHFFYVEVKSKEAYCGMTYAGSFACNVDNAFTSLPLGLRKPDHLIAAGADGYGGILRIGMTGRVDIVPRREMAFSPNFVDPVPNWAPTVDLVDPPRDSIGIFVTSGRAPRGCVAVLESGVKATLYAQISTMDMANSTGIYLLSTAPSEHVLLLVSFPTHSDLIRFSIGEDKGEEVLDVAIGLSETEEPSCNLDLDLETLFASAICSDRILHVSRRSVLIVESSSLRETARLILPSDAIIVSAVLHDSLVVYAYTSKESSEVKLKLATFDRGSDSITTNDQPFSLSGEPTCVKLITLIEKPMLVVSTHDNEVLFFDFPPGSVLRLLSRIHISGGNRNSSIACQSLAILRSDPCTDLLVCGLRDGRVLSFEIDVDSPIFNADVGMQGVQYPVVKAASLRTLSAGTTSVTLFDTGLGLFMISNDRLCRLDRVTRHDAHLEVHQVLFEDIYQDNLRPFPVFSALHVPDNPLFAGHGLSDSILCVSKDGLMSTLPEENPAIVPKTLPLEGTPHRMVIDCDGHALVLSTKIDISKRSHRKARARHVVEVIDPRSYTSQGEPTYKGILSSFQFSSKEKAHCLATWDVDICGVQYNWIAVGTTAVPRESSADSAGAVGGLLVLRKSKLEDGTIQLRKVKYIYLDQKEEGPVHALATYSNQGLIIGTGLSLRIIEFNHNTQSFDTIVRYERLPSPAVRIEWLDRRILGDVLLVTTLKHSILGFNTHVYANADRPGRTTELRPFRSQIDFTYRQTITHHATRVNSVSVFAESPELHTLNLILLADKSATITGLLLRDLELPPYSHTAAFSATLPRTITRLRAAKYLLPRRSNPLIDVDDTPIVGSAADGTFFALRILGVRAWRVLKVLECLVVIASSKQSLTLLCKPTIADAEHAMDVILNIKASRSKAEAETSVVPRPVLREVDWHVDGDRIGYLRTANLRIEVARLVNGAGRELKEAWEGILGDLVDMRDGMRESEGVLEELVVEILGPVF